MIIAKSQGRPSACIIHPIMTPQIASKKFPAKDNDADFSEACGYFQAAKFKEAVILFKKYISKNRLRFDAHFWLGMSYINLGDLEKALNSLLFSASLDKNSFEPHLNIGIIYARMGKPNEALKHYRLALARAPNEPACWCSYGVALSMLSQYQEALACIDRALNLDPHHVDSHLNKANCLHHMHQYEESLIHHNIGASLAPNSPEIWCNQGFTLSALARHQEAICCYDRAIEICPTYFEALWNKSLSQLALGDFENGFTNYEMRWHKNFPDPQSHQNIPPLETIDQLQGSNILVWAEQGFGDTLQFCRYIDHLKKLGANVTFETQPALKKLISRDAGYKVIGRGESFDQIDFQIPLLSLPRLLKLNASTLSTPNPYLFAHQEKVFDWSSNLGKPLTPLRIGIACSGNVAFDMKNGTQRFIALEKLLPLLELGTLHLIQKEISEADAKILAKYPEILFFGNQLNDFEDSAALTANMDLIITVDTSLAHLAGSLGKPTFVLLSHSPDWRWLIGQNTTPWYPNTFLIRQTRFDEWDDVINTALLKSRVFANSANK